MVKKIKMDQILRSKKGIFFTLISVSLLAIVLFSYGTTYSYSLQEQSSLVETRVESMAQFLDSIESDMENAIYISGFRAVVGLTDFILTNATYVSSSEDSLAELFINGSVDNYPSFMMTNNTFPYWVDKINEKGMEIGLNVTIENVTVDVYQEDPWNIVFDVGLQLNLSDAKSTASWIQNKSVKSSVSILGFEDPWYAMHTNGIVLKRINQTIYEGNFTDGANDTSNLRTHIAETMYIAFNASPSFLMRFEDDYGPSPYGIESLVNKTEVLNYCALYTSSVDFMCWTKNQTVDLWNVEGINYTEFKIDNETNDVGISRIDLYGLEDVVST